MRKLLINIIFSFFCIAGIFSQTDSNTLIKNIKQDSSFSIFDNFYLSENINKQQKLISSLNKRIVFYQKKVNSSYLMINNLNSKISIYSKVYAKSLRSYFLLRNSLSSTIVFFLSADSFNQIYSRFLYLKLLISYIQTVHDYLNILKTELKTNKKVLSKYKQILASYITSIQDEKSSLDSNFLTLLKQTAILQQKSTQIRISINNTYKGFEMIQNSIKNIKTGASSPNTSSFAAQCKPLINAIIISSYGVHSHPYLKNVKLRNDGIDLYSRDDTLPKAVAYGIVVKILKIPNFGYSVILKHNDYFSVYSYLHHVYVKQNDTINYGRILGSISKSTSKYSFPCLNFQIWKQTTKLNPNIFLKIN